MDQRLRKLVTALLVLCALPALTPAAADASITRSNIVVSPSSQCGQVRLIIGLTGTSQELTPRLPIRVYASAPDRGLARTLVRTFSSLPGPSEVTPTLFQSEPNGAGAGVQLDVEWTGGSDSFVTEPYVDQCHGWFFPVTPARMLDTRTGEGATAPGRQAIATTLRVDPRPVPGMPADGVTAVAMNLTVAEPAAAGFVTAWPCEAPRPTASNLNFQAGQTIANLVVVDVAGRASTGSICLYSSATTHLIADVTGYFLNDENPRPIGGGIVSLDSPRRALDTRTGAPPSSAGTVRRLPLAGRFDIPTVGLSAVSLNITAVNAQSAGYLTAFPCDATRPNASNVNYVPGRATPNAAIVGLSTSGELCIFSETDVDVLVDVTGYYAIGARAYQPTVPLRVVDTRLGSAIDTRPTARQKLVPGTVTPFRVLFSNTIAVVNITATDVEADGWLTVFPCDRDVPTTSTLNFLAGDTVANATQVRLGATAEMCVYSTAPANLIADLQGLQTSQPRFAVS